MLSVQHNGDLTNQPISQSTAQLITYILHLADNALLLGQRNAEWTGHGPVLEQDIAISNIALDLVGQSRMLYQYAAQLINQSTDQPTNQSTEQPVTEDTLAFLRHEQEFKNCLLVELKRGDWALTVLRQFFFSNYQFYFYQLLQKSKDSMLAAIAEKSLKEVTYHLRWSAEWVIRLGDSTIESHRRMNDALLHLWPYTKELTVNAAYEAFLITDSIAVDLNIIQPLWTDKTMQVLEQATLQIPVEKWMHSGGKEGKHTEHLGYMLAEMQYLQRTYPGNQW